MGRDGRNQGTRGFDPRDHPLNALPRGQQWVQGDSDYVLIAITTGIIAQQVLS